MSKGQHVTSKPISNKPILIGGLSLSMLLWLGGSLYGVAAEWSQDILLTLMLLGGGVWWLKGKKSKDSLAAPLLETIEPEAIAQALEQAEQTLAVVTEEAPQAVDTFKTQLEQQRELNVSQPLQGAVLGASGVGKTSLLNHLDTSPLTWQVASPENVPLDTNLILWLISSDLTESQWQQLKHLRQTAHTVALVLTKQDQRPAEENQSLLAILRQRSQGLLPLENIVAIAANPQPILVRQHQANGQMTETRTTPPPDVQALSARLAQLTTEAACPNLHRATQWRKLRHLTQQMYQTLNQVRRESALPIIERYQWLSAGTAIANPVAALDLLATVAINTQMIIDLGAIYRCRFSLDQAQTATRELGELLVKLGAMELSTQTLSHLYKSNPVTYLAGGALQGVSAAYLTRIVGLSLVDYFAEQDPLTPPQPMLDGSQLSAIVGQWLGQTRRLDLLKSLGNQLSARLQGRSLTVGEA
ncbi:MAG: DUF697 domain-containing protein [Spirulina sp. SIO3F2]|nr:DUF697 domain-containing protein [Spirulina sp. SIO3F2]